MPNQSSQDNFGLNWQGERVSLDDNSCIAKQIYSHHLGVNQYYLKRCMVGVDAGKLYDPLSTNFDIVNANRFYPDRGRYHYEFQRVEEEAFELYSRFIESKQPAFCRQAERAL